MRSSRAQGEPDAVPAPTAGRGWTLVDTQAGDATGGLQSIACASTSQCWAVGSRSGNLQPLIERNTGQGWTVVTNPGQEGRLQSVTCVTTSDCWAVGSSGGGGFIETDAGG